jgi:hypothetical protein
VPLVADVGWGLAIGGALLALGSLALIALGARGIARSRRPA